MGKYAERTHRNGAWPNAMTAPKHLQIFISSPSDVTPEREIVERVVARVSGVWKSYVRLEARNWMREYYEASRGFQESIGDMKEFDVVIGILWGRLGSPLQPEKFKRSDGRPYESGTVFEIETAIANSDGGGKPAVYLFKKTAAFNGTTDNGDSQRQALDRWWTGLVRDEQGHYVRGYQSFESLEQFEESLEGLLQRFLRKGGFVPAGAAWDIEGKGSPYPGLVPYEGAYTDVFFGRALSIAAAMDDLSTSAKHALPVLFVVGPSGSGKSSLVRAGLSLNFSGEQIEGVDFWRQILHEPARDPFLLFAQRLYAPQCIPELAASAQPTAESFAKLASESPDKAAQAIKAELQRAAAAQQTQIGGGRLPVGRLLVVLDQLETVLDRDNEHAFSHFIKMLVESETTWIIATLRSDRYPDLQLNKDFLELRRRGVMYDLPPPGPSEISDIIKGPSRAANLEFEYEGQSLATVLRDEVRGGDALPLLQMTLSRLFDARNGNKLTFKAYRAMGGLEGAIAAHADAVFETVSPAGQATLDALLRALVADIDANGRLTIRTPAYAAVAHDEASQELVKRFVEARLIVNAEGEVRIAHEALLRHWQRATDSPALQPEAIRLRRQIEPNFEAWQRSGRNKELLQAGTTIIAAAEEIVRQHSGAFPPDLEAYVWRSVTAAQAEARRARYRSYAAMAAAAAFGLLAIFAFGFYGRAQDNFSLALLTKAEQLLLDDKPTSALVEAGAAVGSSLPSTVMRRLGLSAPGADKDVRAGTIAAIAEPASKAPLLTLMLNDDANTVAFNPDGSTFAVGDTSGQILVVRTADNHVEARLTGNTGAVTSAKFSPDGQWIAASSYDGTVRLWNLATKDGKVLCGHLSQTNDVAFNPTGRLLASTSNDGHVVVWDLTTFTAAEDFAGGANAGRALAVEFSRDGSLLAASYENGGVVIRHTANWDALPIAADRKDIVGISFSADGKWIATAGVEGALDIWTTATGAKVSSITDHPTKLWKVRFSPDGRLLAAASWDGAARFWNGQTFQYLGSIDGNDHWVNDIAFSPDSSLLATADQAGATRVWSIDIMMPMFYAIRDTTTETLIGRYSPDGSAFVSGGRDRYARLYQVDALGGFKYQCRVSHADWVFSVAFSPDGKTVISAGTSQGKSDNVIQLWSAAGCTPQPAIPVGSALVDSLAVSPDGKWIAWGSATGQIWLVDLGAGNKQIKLDDHHTGPINALDFSPDGKLLASGGQDARVAIWSVDDKMFLRGLSGHRQEIEAVRFTPDGKRVASAGADGVILLWDPGRQAPPIASLDVRGGAGTLAFSPDGSVLAAGSDERFISMWHTESWQKMFELDALVGVRGVFGFHPKRGDLAFDGEDGLLRVLPSALSEQKSAAKINATLVGTDIFFDKIPSNVPQSSDMTAITSAGACPVQ